MKVTSSLRVNFLEFFKLVEDTLAIFGAKYIPPVFFPLCPSFSRLRQISFIFIVEAEGIPDFLNFLLFVTGPETLEKPDYST